MIKMIIKNKPYIFCLSLLIMVLMLIVLPFTAKSQMAEASDSLEISLSNNSFTVYEAEEYSYIQLSYSGDPSAYLPFSLGYSVTGGTAVRGENYTTQTENLLPAVIYNGLLCLRLTMIKSDSYDSGKTLEIAITFPDSDIIINGIDSCSLQFKDQNPDGYAAIVSEDKEVFENGNETSFTVQVSPNYFGATIGLVYSGNAVRGTDYTAPASVFLAAGVTTVDVPVALLNNATQEESDRIINVYIDTTTAGSEIAAIANNTTITINDDESIGTISLFKTADTITEQDGDYVILVIRNGGCQGNLSFNLDMTTTASAGVQYESSPEGTYELLDGETYKIIRLKLIEDRTYTYDETFTFTITGNNGAVIENPSLTLTRRDSIEASEIYFSTTDRIEGEEVSDKLNFSLTEDTDNGNFSFEILKTAGGNVSFKIAVSMQTADTSLYNGESIIEVLGGEYLSGVLQTINFSKITDGVYRGDNKIYLRFYDFNEGTTINGLTDYTVTIDVKDPAENGVYRLEEPARNGNYFSFPVVTVTPSAENIVTVNYTVYGVTGANQTAITSGAINFSPITYKANIGFDATNYINSYSSFRIVLTPADIHSTVNNGTRDFDAFSGRGGELGLYNTYINISDIYATEGGYLQLNVYRDTTAFAIDAELYFKNESIYFDYNEAVATVHFDEGQTLAVVNISIPKNGLITTAENNIIYIAANNSYSVVDYKKYAASGYIRPEMNVKIYNSDDYGKVGFIENEITVAEGEQFDISLYLAAEAVNTPVTLYVADTNLPSVPEFGGVTVSYINGEKITFNYNDTTYFAPDNLGYVTLGIITYQGDGRLNGSGTVSGKDTFTVYFEENDAGASVGFSDKYGNYLSGSNLAVELNEDAFGSNFYRVYINSDVSENWTGGVFCQLYTETAAGSTSIINFNSSVTVGENVCYADLYFDYTSASSDNVFYIKLRTTSLSSKVLTGSATVTVTVKNTVPVCNILSEPQSLNEGECEADFVFTRNNTDYALDCSFADYAAVLTSLRGSGEIYVNDTKLTSNGFVWPKGNDSIEVTVKWSDDEYYDSLKTLDLSLEGDRIISEPVYLFITDNEINAELGFTSDVLEYTQTNAYLFAETDNVSHYLRNNTTYIKTDELRFNLNIADILANQPDLNGFYVYYTLEAVNEEAENIGWRNQLCSSLPCNFSSYVDSDKRYIALLHDNDNTVAENAVYKLTLTGCSLAGIGVNEANLNKRVIYIEYTDTSNINLNLSSNETYLYNSDDYIDVDIEKTNGVEHNLTLTYVLNAEAVAAGYTLSNAGGTMAGEDNLYGQVRIISPSAANLLSDLTLTVSYVSNDTGASGSKSITITVLPMDEYVFNIDDKVTATEGDSVTINVSRTSDTGEGSVSWRVITTDERIAGIRSGTVYFEDLLTSKTITLTTLNDVLVNGDKLIKVELYDAVGSVNIENKYCCVYLEDNDTLLCAVTPYSFNEIFVKAIYGDFDADGLGDALGVMSDGTIVVYFNNGSSYSKKIISTGWGIPLSIDYGELNGESGCDCVLLFDLFAGELFFNSERAVTTQKAYLDISENVYLGDINGDGISELCYLNCGRVYYYTATSGGFGTQSSYLNYTDNAVSIYKCDGVLYVKDIYTYYNSAVITILAYQNGKGRTAFVTTGYNANAINTTAQDILYNGTQNSVVFTAGNYAYVDGFTVALSGNPTDIKTANIDSDKEDEVILLINKKLYVLNKYTINGAVKYVLGDALTTAGDVVSFAVSDIHGTGVSSVYYLSNGKVNLIENPYNYTVISFEVQELTVSDTDAYAEIIITRTGSLNVPYTVDLSTLRGTAIAGYDYAVNNISVTFGAKETTKTVRIRLIDSDDIPVNTKYFTVSLTKSNPNIVLNYDELTVYIEDTDRSGVVEFEETAYEVFENAGTLEIPVTRTAGTHNAVVYYSITLNCLVYGEDMTVANENFVNLSGYLVFGRYEYEKNVIVNIIDNGIFDGLSGADYITERYICITLTSVECTDYDYGESGFGAQLGDNVSLSVHINDDEESLIIEEVEESEIMECKVSGGYDFNLDGYDDEMEIVSGNLVLTVSDFASVAGGNIEELYSTYTYALADLLASYNASVSSVKLMYSKAFNQFVLIAYDKFYTFRFTGSSMVSAGNSGNIDASSFQKRYGSETSPLNYLTAAGDLDGDDEVDFAVFYQKLTFPTSQFNMSYQYENYMYAQCKTLVYYTALSSDNYALEYQDEINYYFTINSKESYEVFFDDFNTDGIDDIIIFNNQDYLEYALSENGSFGLFERIYDFSEFSTYDSSYFCRIVKGEYAGEVENEESSFEGWINRYEYFTEDALEFYFFKTASGNSVNMLIFDNRNGNYAYLMINSENELKVISKGCIEDYIKTYKNIDFCLNPETGEVYLRLIHSESESALKDYLGGNQSVKSNLTFNYAKLAVGFEGISVSDISADEDAGVCNITINNPSGNADRIYVYSVDGTAVYGINGDYYADCNYIDIAEGVYQAVYTFRLTGNSFYDCDKYFEIYIKSAENQFCLVNHARVDIVDNDSEPVTAELENYYFVNSDITYTAAALTGYGITNYKMYEDGELILTSDTDVLNFSFSDTGVKNIIIYGYNIYGRRVYVKKLSAEIITNNGFTAKISMPETVSVGNQITVKFTLFANGAANKTYPIANAVFTFNDPFSFETVTAVTNGLGEAACNLIVTAGELGVVNLYASMAAAAQGLSGNTSFSARIVDNNGAITGYVLMPGGNIGASDILISLGNNNVTTDSYGYFSIAAVSGYEYTLTVNKNRANTFYRSNTVLVNHYQAKSIVSVTLEEYNEETLSFDVYYFYNNYTGQYYQTTVGAEIYKLPYCEMDYDYLRLSMESGYADASAVAAMNIFVPSNNNSISVSRRYVVQSTFSSEEKWAELAWASSGTELYFAVKSGSVAGTNAYDNIEFVICDANGNTKAVISDVTRFDEYYLDVYKNTGLGQYYQTYSLSTEYDRTKVEVGGCDYDYNYGDYSDMIYKVALKNGDVENGDRIYIRRTTSNDLMYYYTGITLGKSVGEMVRDDVADQLAAVKTEAFPSQMQFMEDFVFSLNFYGTEYSTVSNEDGTCTVYLGYCVSTKNIDATPKSKSGSIGLLKDLPMGSNFGVSIKAGGEIALYFGGVFEMQYNRTSESWEYVSGSVRILGLSSEFVKVTFSYQICAAVSVYGYMLTGSSLTTNMQINVVDGILELYGSTTSELYVEVGSGISIILAKGELWARVTGTYQIYFGETEGSKMSIYLSGGATVYALWFCYRYTWYNVGFTYDMVNNQIDEGQLEQTLQNLEDSGYDAYCVTIDTEGIIEGSPDSVPNIETAAIVGETNINSRPSVVEFTQNGVTKKMMIYSQQALIGGVECQNLFYMIMTDGVWNAPRLVFNGVANVSDFAVTVFKNNPVIAFSYTSGAGNIAEQYQTSEIAVAKFNGSDFVCSNLTSDTLPDNYPMIAAEGNNLIVTYVKTYRADFTMDMTIGDMVFSDRSLNYLMYSVWDDGAFAASKVFRRGAYNMYDCDMSVVNGRAYLMLLADMDGNIKTDADSEVISFVYTFGSDVWAAGINISQNAVAESAIRILDVNGTPTYFWLNKYGINLKSGNNAAVIVNTREQGDISYFNAANYGSSIVLAWTEKTVNIQESNYDNIYFMIYDGDESIRKQLASTANIIIDFDITLADGKIYFVFSESEIDTTESVSNPDITYSIIGGTVYFSNSASAENVYTASGKLRVGKQETFFFDVTNYGETNLSNINAVVRINDANGAVISNLTIESLAKGASRTLSFAYTPLAADAMYGLFITVESSSAAQSASDSAQSSAEGDGALGSNSFTLAKELLDINSLQHFVLNGKLNLLVNIENGGDCGSGGTLYLQLYGNSSVSFYSGAFTADTGAIIQQLLQLDLSALEQYADGNGRIKFYLYIDSETAALENYAEVVYFTLPDKVNLSFMVDGAFFGVISSYGYLTEFPTAPEKKGYVFTGWYLDAECTIKAALPMIITENTVLYAGWEKEKHNGWIIWLSAILLLLLSAAAVAVIFIYNVSKINLNFLKTEESLEKDFNFETEVNPDRHIEENGNGGNSK